MFKKLTKPIKYFTDGLVVITHIIQKIIYYIFYGTFTLILLIPNLLIKLITPKNKDRRLALSGAFVNNSIITAFLIIYLVGIYYIARNYVQEERCKKFSKSLIESTEKIEEIESQVVIIEEPKEEITTTTITEQTTPKYNYVPYNYLDYLTIDPKNYANINNEIVGWLKVDGTNINISVVQAKDNSYYLDHDIYKRKSVTGWIFGDYRNDFENLNKNTIIYGHNMANGSMFGTLQRVNNNYWLSNETYHYIKLNTKTNKTTWKVFSVYTIDPVVDYLQTKFNNVEEYGKFLKKMKSRSIYNFNVEVTTDDYILTLQTCDNVGNKRLIVQAKLFNLDKY